ncbi:MAG: hypothetical protein ACXWNG_02040 [Candidatus Limnocylindrales bacterium]
MRLKVIGAVGLMAIGIGAVGLVVVGPSLAGTPTTQYLTAQATVGNVVAQAVATGNVAASATYGLRFGAQADLVSSTSGSSTASSTGNSSASGSSTAWTTTTVSAKVGDQVKHGQTLAVADGTSAQLQLTTAQANLSAAQAKLTLDQGGPDANTRAAAYDQVSQAQFQLSQAAQNQADTQSQNALNLSQAASAVTNAQQQLSSDTSAGKPQAVLDQDAAALSNAQAALASTQVKVKASNDQAANQVRSAQLGLTSAQHGYATKVAPATPAQIQADEAQVASAKAALQTAQQAVGAATIVAPVAGTVVAVNIVAGMVAPSGYAIEVQTGQLVVTASFAETDVTSIKVGQAASVAIAAAKATVDATVSQILPVGSASGSNSVVTYQVQVTLTNPPATVLAGMSANVAVTTAEAQNVIAVPAIAVVGSTGNYSVRVMDAGGQPQLRSVQVGLVTSSLAEVRSGLSEGDTVVTGTVSQRTSTTTTGGAGIGGLGGAGLGGAGFGGRGTGTGTRGTGGGTGQ